MPQSSNFFAALDDSDDDSVTHQVTKRQPVSITANSGRSGGSNASGSAVKKNDRRNNHTGRNDSKGGRGRPNARDGKRTYDRRSGTGRGKEIRKGGGGPRNWGSDKVDARSAEGVLDENQVEKAPVEGEEVGAALDAEEDVNKEEEPVEPEPEPEPEPVTRTLDEYYEDRKNELKDLPQFQERAKREVDNEFSGFKARAAAKEEDFLKMGTGKAIRKKTGGSGKKEAETVQLGFRVGSKPGGGRGRGDRGDRGDRDGDRGSYRGDRDGDRGGYRGDRREGGGRGRGRGRGDRRRGGDRSGGRSAPAVDPLDPSSFPSL